MQAVFPTDEQERLRVLRSYCVLDTEPEERFDRITRIAARLFDVPISLVSLVDECRQWFKSSYGMDAAETDRSLSFCAHAILSEEVMVVEDARLDPRFSGNLQVTGTPGIRFYAGAPLTTPDGTRLGTLCVIDLKPRTFTSEDEKALSDLAAVVMEELGRSLFERKLARSEQDRLAGARRLSEAAARLHRMDLLASRTTNGIVITDEEGRIEWVNEGFTRITGYTIPEVRGCRPSDFLRGQDSDPETAARIEAAMLRGEGFKAEIRNYRKTGEGYWVRLDVEPLAGEDGRPAGYMSIQTDVTAEKEATLALAHSEEMLAGILNTSLDGISAFDAVRDEDGRIVDFEWTHLNPSAAAFIGRGEFVGKRLLKEFPVVGANGLFDAYVQVVETGAPFRRLVYFEQEHLNVWLELSAVRRGGGLSLSFRDVTSQRETECALHRSRAQFQGIIDSAMDAIVTIDAGHRITLFNRAAEKLFGYAGEEVVGRRIEMLMPERFRARHREYVDRFTASMRAKHPTGLLGRLVGFTKDGVEFPVEASISQVEVGDERLSTVILRDRREREAQERDLRRKTDELRESEGRYRALSQLVRTFAYAYTHGEDALPQVEWVTDSVTDVLGYSPEEMKGMAWGSLVHEDDRDLTQARLHRVLAGETAIDEFRMRTKEGRAIWVRSLVYPEWSEAEGRVVRIYGAIQDVTAQKDAERELREAKEHAEEMARLKDAFLANMSHEIRTPLTSIIGFSEILAEEFEGEGQEFVGLIHKGGKRLLETLNSVLDLAQLESGSRKVRAAPVDVAAAAHTVVELFRPQADQQGLYLHLKADAARASSLLDEAALNRVLSNLVSNAVKFTAQGGVSVSVRASGADVEIRVSDTGIGISEAFLPHLYDEFRQESTGTARSYEGSGLGLTITRRLVQMMGGSISVESRKGAGTAFTIRFPRLEDQAPASTLEDAALGPADMKPRLLVLEDSPEAQLLFRRVLAAQYDVDVVATAEEALRLAERNRYAAFVLDVHLGGDVTGLEVLRHFRQMPQYTEAPAIACTAYALPGDEERFRAAGFDGYVGKPFRRRELLAVLSGVLAA